ncbi:hypothetical protein [Hymenobacter pini]|uniref:hypothetical protein n=1 Tax=Hymenobacter pini TaxID=2880879 RepID=UPI001CF26168|nr:hypothetical protein [Hymenobacter pini]MCA8829955.1 hypothetical protein [Hymenobacter pini]
MKHIALLGVLVAAFTTHESIAQVTASDTTLLAASIGQASSLYHATFANSSLYNGPQYVFYTKLARKTEGNPYFETDQFRPGTIVYSNNRYDGIPLLYDTRLDQLVVQHPSSTLFMSLISPQVNSFTVNGHQFAYYPGNSTVEMPATAGFYEVLLAGKNALLGRYTKTMAKRARNNIVEYTFQDKTRYYVYTGQGYYPVSSAGSLAKVFPDHKKQIQQFAKEHKLAFSKDSRAASLASLVAYTNTLQ